VKKKEDISNNEKKLWEEYLKNPKDIFDKELENTKKQDRGKRFRFDLHGFTLLEANKKVREIIIRCQENSFKEILLITGKGLHSNTDQNAYVSKELSKLKFSVPEYIKTQKDLSDRILSIEAAKINNGGEGAIIIKLKKL
jgi:DNA-nicking Smr family endonuclease|tara:strand:+ start:129 stop:548 length:420 start_codon:yes stop_codon:yes gene_type:complete